MVGSEPWGCSGWWGGAGDRGGGGSGQGLVLEEVVTVDRGLGSYASRRGHSLIDRRPYGPESWVGAGAIKCWQCGCRRTWSSGPSWRWGWGCCGAWGQVPWKWVTTDAAHGDHHDLRQAVEAMGKWYRSSVDRGLGLGGPERAAERGRPRPGCGGGDQEAPGDGFARLRVVERRCRRRTLSRRLLMRSPSRASRGADGTAAHRPPTARGVQVL